MRLLARLKQRSAEKALLQRLQLIEHSDISIMDTTFHEEVVETVEEQGNTIFVGATAKFDENWQIQLLKPDRVTKFGIEPNFESRRCDLEHAAKCTCFIFRPSKSGSMLTGTAFFVGPTTLVSVGHMASEKGTKLLAQLPGTLRAERRTTGLWLHPNDPKSPETFACYISKSLYKQNKPDRSRDIAILSCKGSYEASQWLEINQMPLQEGLSVDLIGYPGSYTASALDHTQGFVLSDAQEQDVWQILPRCELTLSHGTVLERGALVSYKLSTTGGMSGGPVIVNRKAVGIHIGGHRDTHNKCLPFENPEVAKLVKDALGDRRSLITRLVNGISSLPRSRTGSSTSLASRNTSVSGDGRIDG